MYLAAVMPSFRINAPSLNLYFRTIADRKSLQCKGGSL